ncbi:MAG TPA: cysteine desulfurase family protein, partial [Rhabdochlamydiaceae bacterium]|nr:cysteine desulfurase family protein [Rhabdochlamydiaceae bacterium]
MKKIYLDNNATTALDPRVIEAMQEVLTPIPFNSSSIHSFGQESKKLLTKSRDTIAHALHVKPQELVFTSGGTEALNLLLRGFPASHIITSNVEHPAVRETLKSLDAKVTYLPAGLWGAIQPHQLEQALTPETDLIVLTAANNITGVKTDIAAIAHIAHQRNIPFIVDGVQLLGKETFHIPPGVSAMAFSGHKIHGPTGIGLAFVRSSYKLSPQITGGSQEYGRRAGTENLLGIVGLAKAIELLATELPAATNRMRTLRDKLTEGLMENLGNIVIHGEGPRICNTVHIGFPGIDGETLLLQLDLAGIAASHGSACTSGGLEPSPILLNMQIPASLARTSIRFSLSRMTTEP